LHCCNRLLSNARSIESLIKYRLPIILIITLTIYRYLGFKIIPLPFMRQSLILGVHTVCYAFLGFSRFPHWVDFTNEISSREIIPTIVLIFPGWNFSLVSYTWDTEIHTPCGPQLPSTYFVVWISHKGCHCIFQNRDLRVREYERIAVNPDKYLHFFWLFVLKRIKIVKNSFTQGMQRHFLFIFRR